MKSADDHVIRIVLSLGKGPHRVEADLEERELAAIGYVTTQWAFLEHLILESTVALCSGSKAQIPADATSLAFENRRRAWRQTIEKFATTHEKEKLLKLMSTAANLEQRRHQIGHGLWASDPADPETLVAFSFRPRVQFEAEYDFEGLIKLGNDIGELCFKLAFPGGKEESYAAVADLIERRDGYVSRRFKLSAADKNAHRKKRPRTGNRPKRKSKGKAQH
jgi:hypothetical protein